MPMPATVKMPEQGGDRYRFDQSIGHRLLVRVNSLRDGIFTQYTDREKNPQGDSATLVDMVDFDAKGADGKPLVLKDVQVLTRVPQDKFRNTFTSSGAGSLLVVKVVKVTSKSGNEYTSVEDIDPEIANVYWDRVSQGDPWREAMPAVATTPQPEAASSAPAAPAGVEETPDWMKD